MSLCALTIIFAQTAIVQAQPAVTGSSGTWSHQGTVTIAGAGFGSKTTAAPIVWDDASGASIGSKWSGAWPNCGASPLAYRTPAQAGRGIPLPHNNITKYISGAHAGSTANCGYNVIMFKTRTVSLPAYTYATWYERVDDNWNFGDDDNFKTFAYSVGTTPYELPNNWYLEYNPRPTSPTSGAVYHINDDGSSLQTPDVNGHSWWWDPAVNPMSGVWKKIEMELRYTTATDGYIKLWENGTLKVNYRGRTDNLGGTTRTEGIGGYARNYGIAGNWRYFADVYLDYSRARVILGNAPTLAASTRREVQVPSSWSSSSITVSANLGTFSSGEIAYVYVFDANGVANSSGLAVTIGTGGTPPPPDTTPPSVTATSPANGVTGVSVTSTVTVTFNEPMDASTITSTTVQVRNPLSVLVTSAVSYDAATRRAVLTHVTPFSNASPYTASVKGGTGGVKDAAGNLLSSDHGWSFTTAAAPPPPGVLVASYSFNENTGTAVADASGNSNNGTISGAAWTASGKYGSGLSFNGTNAWVTTNPAISLALPDAMTLEAWVYPTALSGWKTVLMKETDAGLAYALYAHDNSPWPATYVRISGATSSVGTPGTTALPLNTWTHLASTYNGSAITLYVNGTAVSTEPATGTVTASTGPLRIGGNNIWGEYFTGVIDEVRIYSRALSVTEIQADMTAPVVAPDTTPPTVTAATPAAGATGVSSGTTVTATFSEAMDATSVSATSFELRTSASTLVPASVGYNAGTRVATLTPSSALTGGGTYTATVKGGSGGVRDSAANALASNHAWSFTTTVPPPPADTTPPTVTAVSPANGATGASIASQAFVTFSEAMTALTVSTSTIELRNASNALVAATVNYDSVTRTATLTPSSVLLNGMVYTITVTASANGVKDVAGNALASTFTSSFTTVAVVPTGTLVASYGFNQSIGLAAWDGSGNSNTGTISGAAWTTAGKFGSGLEFDGTADWVTVPHAATLGLTTAMTLEAWVYPTALSGWNTVLMKETGTGIAYGVYANDNSPKPAAYIRIAGASGSDGASGASPLPLNTWTHLAATYDGTSLKLFVNGAQVYNQPATGSLTASTGPLHIGGNTMWGEHFAGTIDEVRIYSRALSVTEIQADMNAPVVAPDTTPPTVTAATPAAGATDVSSGTTVTATFSEAMDATSVTATSFELRNAAGALVPAAVGYNAGPRVATLTPSSTLTGSVTYTATVKGASGGVRDAAANALAANYTWSFRTVAPPDTTPPTVSSVSPANGATGGSVASPAIVTFSEAMNAATISTSTIALRNASNGLVAATVNYDSGTRTATLTPSSVLSNDMVYTVTVESGASGVKDAAGNALAATFTSSFTTVAAPPTGALVASYSFNENGGMTAYDDSGNNHTGTIAGASWTPGKFGSGLEFNGTTDWVTVPHAAALVLTNAMTLEAWVYPTALSGWNTVVMKEKSSNLAYALYANDNSPKPAAYIRIAGASSSDGASGPWPLALNTWTHLAATYDGATLTLVVNGTYAYSFPASGSMSASTGPLHIGGNALWGEYFTGVIDEVRIYSRALSMTEIQADMAAPVGGGPIDAAALTVGLRVMTPGALVTRGGGSRQSAVVPAKTRTTPVPTPR